jgi:mutator protein MutT
MKISTAGVIWENNQMLIAKRVRDGFWEFPGGKIDPGETAEHCVAREIKEELNIEVNVEKRLGEIKGFFRYTDMVVHVFLLSKIAGEPTCHPEVHTNIQWISLEDCENYRFIDEDRGIFDLLPEKLWQR